MQENFWKKIAKRKTASKQGRPFFCLAPMSDVTDAPFRKIIAKHSKNGPDVFWTEFVSADGLVSKEGRKKLLPILKYSRSEKPIIAQIFGSKPENIEKACEMIAKLGFDGIDLNMGCPDKKIERQGAGSALIKNHKLAREIIRSAIKGIELSGKKIPVSVKTRIGYNKIEYKEWLSEIIKEDISALTIHLRTRKEMSKVPAHWEIAKEIVDFIRSENKDLILIGNGDVKSKKEGIELSKKSGFDGIMVGRGIFGNPWFFSEKTKVSVNQKLKVLLEHTKLFEKLMKGNKNFAVMKKHFKAYVNGFDGARELRIELMDTNNFKEVEKVINNFLYKNTP